MGSTYLHDCPCCDQRYMIFQEGSRENPNTGKPIPGYRVWCSSCGLMASLVTYDPIITSGKELAKKGAEKTWNTRGGVYLGTRHEPIVMKAKTKADVMKALRIGAVFELDHVMWSPNSINPRVYMPAGTPQETLILELDIRVIPAADKPIFNHDDVKLTLRPIKDSFKFTALQAQNASDKEKV